MKDDFGQRANAFRTARFSSFLCGVRSERGTWMSRIAQPDSTCKSMMTQTSQIRYRLAFAPQVQTNRDFSLVGGDYDVASVR